MTGVLVVTGVVSTMVTVAGSAVVYCIAAYTDAHERLREKILHKIWW